MTTPSQIRYLNTDLDVVCDTDPAALVAELESFGLYVHRHDGDDGFHSLMCEGQNEAESQQNIELLLKAIESLSQDSRTFRDRHFAQRELNVGYDCGDEPWAHNQAFHTALFIGCLMQAFPFESRCIQIDLATPQRSLIRVPESLPHKIPDELQSFRDA